MKKINSLRVLLQKGVTMLEMMLVLAIISILLILATRYYETTHSAALVNAALESIQAIYSAEQQYCNDYDCSTQQPNVQKLVDKGLLPHNFISYANPWGEITDLTVSSYPLAVSFSNVPSRYCTNIKQKVTASYDNTDVQIPMECPTDGSLANMEVDFH